MTGKIIATCGHELPEMWEDIPVVMRRSWSREGGRAVSYEMLCESCTRAARAAGELLESDAEATAWMRFSGDGDDES